jgi:RimJ/RimL family protein N-acetyltransferase
MNPDIRIRPIGLPHRDLLAAMYDGFDPLGAALGLPPFKVAARERWIQRALEQTVNVAAFSLFGVLAAHCFLAADEPGSAELAIFVHQGFRRRGVGMALVKAALERARLEGIRRVWAMTSPENRPALRLLAKCGMRLTKSTSYEAELEIHLAGTLPSARTLSLSA